MNEGHDPAEPVRVMRIIARLNIGGPAIHVALLTAGLNDEVFQSMLVTGSISESEGDMSYIAEEMGVQPLILEKMEREISLMNDLRTVWNLIRLMRTWKPHIVHTHTAKAGFGGRLAAFITGVPVVLHTFHGHVFHGYFGPLKTMLFLWLERAAAQMSDVILTISDLLRKELIEYKVAPPNKIRVIPLGLPLERLTKPAQYRGKLRAEAGYSQREKLVGIIGRLVPIKNHELFLEAAQRLKEQLPDVRFFIIGDGERRAELERIVDAMGLQNVVTFTGWRSDLPVIYADLDCVVITSHNEGTPVSLIEAMAAGVPVVSTAVGGVPDLLQNGRVGRLVPPGDAPALAEAIHESLTENNDERIKMARRWVLNGYGAHRLIADMHALYTEYLKRKGFSVGSNKQGAR